MKTAKAIYLFLGICIGMPIWYFLFYTMLKAAHPDRLIWFLFWVYMVVTVVTAVIAKIAEEKKKP